MGKPHRVLLAVVGLVCVIAIAGGVLLRPPAARDVDAPTADSATLHDATLTGVAQVDTEAGAGLAQDTQTLKITAVLADGREVAMEMVDETGNMFSVGQRVRVAEAVGPDGEASFYVNDIQRSRPLLILFALFLLAVLAFGRWQGARALVGLALTLGVVAAFVVPAVLAGRDPVLVALSAAVLIMVVTLYLTHGVQPKTTAAVIGTLAALGVTAGLSWLFIQLTSLTGLSSEEARMASLQVGGLSLQGLLLAGIIIGALGVLDDVTMAQASTVFALRRTDPRAGFTTLFSEGMSVGRDHVAATINTLFLAYVGASLPLLILFSGSPDPLPVILSSEIVAVEIVRTLVGSIGLMASVPATTALAAWLARATVGATTSRGDDIAADDEIAADDAIGTPDERRRTRAHRGSDAHDGPGPFNGSSETGVELEWERRLRSSYGLDRAHRPVAEPDDRHSR